MSHSVSVGTDRHSTPPAEETVRTEGAITELLAVLDDQDCRAVLEATGSEPLTAKEITQRCDLSSSTTYRKIDRLVDADLLAEEIRISGTGKHASEYSRSVDRVELSIGDAGTELQVERGSVNKPQLAD